MPRFPRSFTGNTIPLQESGILVFSVMGREQDSGFEMKRIISMFYEDRYVSENGNECEQDLKTELAKLRSIEERNKFKFTVMPNIHCVSFMSLPEDIDPPEFICALLEELKKSPKRTRFTQRILPVLRTCRANLNEIIKNSREVLEKYYPHLSSEPRSPPSVYPSWGLLPKIRMNNSISRGDLVKGFGQLIGSEYPVNLDNPDLLITVTIFQKNCFIGACKSYVALNRYGLQKLSSQSDRQLISEEKLTEICE